MAEIKLGKKTAYTTVMSPKGELTGFNAIFKPSTTYNKSGLYNANILISKEEGEKLLAIIKEVQKEQFKNFKQKNDKLTEISGLKPYTTVDDEGKEIADSQGRYILKTKAHAQIKDDKIGYKVAVFDSKLHPVKELPIGNGSIVKLKLDLTGYSVGGKIGVSIKLVALQLIKYIPYDNNSKAVEGFTEEDGYDINQGDEEVPGIDDDDEINEEEIPF